jgi:hypothetical protein
LQRTCSTASGHQPRDSKGLFQPRLDQPARVEQSFTVEDLTRLHPFGCDAFLHDPSATTKTGERAVRAIYLGSDAPSAPLHPVTLDGYRVLLATGQIVVSRDIQVHHTFNHAHRLPRHAPPRAPVVSSQPPPPPLPTSDVVSL